MQRRLLLAVPVALVLALVVCAPALALSKPRWKSPTITYRDASKGKLDRGAVKVAIKWWNDAPGPVVLKKVASGGRANVTFRSTNTPDAEYDGLASYTTDSTGTFIQTVRLDLNDYYLSREDPEYVAEVTAHELGHGLGLPHLNDRCSLMYPSGSVATRCPRNAGRGSPGSGRYYCGPQRSDVSSALARYGGSLGNWKGTICNGTPPSSRRGFARATRHG